MAFAASLFLWALFGLPLILLLAAWRRRPRDVAVPSLVLWRQVAERMASAPSDARARRSPLALMLTLLAFAMAVLAAASPAVEQQAVRPRRVLILADRSVISSLPAADRAADSATGWSRIVAWIEAYAAELNARDQLRLLVQPTPLVDPVFDGRPADVAATLTGVSASHAASRIDSVASAWLAAPGAIDQLVVVSCAAAPTWWPPDTAAARWVTIGVERLPVITQVDGDAHGLLVRVAMSPDAADAPTARVRCFAGRDAASVLQAERGAPAADAHEWTVDAHAARGDDSGQLTAWFDWTAAPAGARDATWYMLRPEPAGAPAWLVRRWRPARVLDACGVLEADGGSWARTWRAVLPDVQLDDAASPRGDGDGDGNGNGDDDATVTVAALYDSAERARDSIAGATRVVWGQTQSDAWVRVSDPVADAALADAALEADPEATVLRAIDVATLPFAAPLRIEAAPGGQFDAVPLALVLADGERVPLIARVRRGRETCWIVNAPPFAAASASQWRTTLATWTLLANLFEVASGRPILDPPALEAAIAGDVVDVPEGIDEIAFRDIADDLARVPIAVDRAGSILIDRAGLLTLVLESGTTRSIPLRPAAPTSSGRAARVETPTASVIAATLPAQTATSRDGFELLPLLLALAALALRATRRE